MTATDHCLFLRSEVETDRLGKALAPLLRPGDTLLFWGEIGAGKSALARSIIRALCGADTEVPSPTYTLVQTYPAPGGDIWHSDLYRLGDAEEALELGLTEAFDTAICLVEWPDRLGPDLPGDALQIHLAATPDGHSARLSLTPAWADRLAGALASAP
jgi:tRNA threonylcarbamoyladenosine biosynthesis protein TsaE